MVKLLVVVTCHNYGPYLAECLQSIADQSYEDWRCVIVDDASTDHSVPVARAFCAKDDRFCLVENKRNLGVAESRNIGIEYMDSEYWICFDADDVMYPTLLETLLDALETYPNYGFAYCQPDGVNWRCPPFFAENLRTFNFITISTLVRRAEAQYVRFESGWRSHEDWLFWGTLVLRDHVQGVLVDRKLFFYRQHGVGRNALNFEDIQKDMREVSTQLQRYR